MADVPVWVPLVSAIAGGSLVGVFNFAMRWQDRRAEGKRHLREIAFKAAIEEWKQHLSFAVEVNKTTGRKSFVQPLIAYLIHQIKISDIFLEGEITKENLSAKFSEVDKIMEELNKFTGTPKKDQT